MERRTIKICTRLTPEEDTLLRKAAKLAGFKTISGYLRKCSIWNAKNPDTKINHLIAEQVDEVVTQIKMLVSLTYKNPKPDDQKIKLVHKTIEAKIRSWLK